MQASWKSRPDRGHKAQVTNLKCKRTRIKGDLRINQSKTSEDNEENPDRCNLSVDN